jgi:hypothetical protein
MNFSYKFKKEKQMVKTSNVMLMALLTLVLGAGVAMAQQDHAAMTDQSQSTSKSGDMMKSCHKYGSETMATLDRLEKAIAEGRESNDPAKMRMALDTAQKQLVEARRHMSMCPMMGGDKMQDGGMEHMDHMKGMPGDPEQH